MLEWECYLENYISRLSFLRTENIHYIKLKKQSVRNHLFWHLKNLLPRIIHKSQHHSKKFVALTMTNDFIDIKVIGHGRGKQPKRRDTKKGWVQIHGLDICIPHTCCSKIRKKKVNFSILPPFFKFYFRMFQTVCVSYTDDWLSTKGSFGLSEIK